MAPHQFEFGILVVIELYLGPLDKGMTGLAFFTESAFMVVVTPVAVNTISFQFFLKIVLLMAGVAFRLLMSAAERELGFIMVKLGFRPAGGIVAFVAFFPKPSFMNVVKRVTFYACCGRAFVTLIGVTTVARDFLMFARQSEFGLGMVEPAFFPRSFRMAV